MIRKVHIYGEDISSHRTGSLHDINVSIINHVLGFEPNYDDDPDKVENSWAFTVDDFACAIWDYNGSHRVGTYSTFGPDDVFADLFGDKYASFGHSINNVVL